MKQNRKNTPKENFHMKTRKPALAAVSLFAALSVLAPGGAVADSVADAGADTVAGTDTVTYTFTRTQSIRLRRIRRLAAHPTYWRAALDCSSSSG